MTYSHHTIDFLPGYLLRRIGDCPISSLLQRHWKYPLR
jgi:hypothetical protein